MNSELLAESSEDSQVESCVYMGDQSSATDGSSKPRTCEQAIFSEGYYRHVYSDYDLQNPRKKLWHYQQLVVNQPLGGEFPCIHDIGCAFGRFLGVLGADWNRYGSDVSEYAIGKARAEQPECTFSVAEMGRVEGQGFPEKFSAVTAFDSIEHMPDVEQLAENVKAQLMPGGTFIFVVPVYDGLSGPIIRLLDRDPTHLHKWPRRRWLDWAGRHFEVVRWHGVLRYLLPWGWYLHWPTRLCRWHTPAILAVCRKKA